LPNIDKTSQNFVDRNDHPPTTTISRKRAGGASGARLAALAFKMDEFTPRTVWMFKELGRKETWKTTTLQIWERH